MEKNPQPSTLNNSSHKKDQNKKPKSRKPGYIATVIFNILFLYVANNLVAWKAQFITGAWSQVLWIINVSIILNLIVYAVFVFYEGRLFYFISRSALEAMGFIVAYRLYTIFPFDFKGFFQMGWLNEVFPYFLLLGMFGTAISLIVRTVKFASGKNIYY